jgi:hypothetical protein
VDDLVLSDRSRLCSGVESHDGAISRYKLHEWVGFRNRESGEHWVIDHGINRFNRRGSEGMKTADV